MGHFRFVVSHLFTQEKGERMGHGALRRVGRARLDLWYPTLSPEKKAKGWGTHRSWNGMRLLYPLEAEACLANRVADGGDVRCAARFERNIDHRFTQAYAVVRAVVDGFDNVGALAG